MADLGTAYVNITPKAPGIKKELENILGDNMPNTEESGKKMGSSLLSGLKKIFVGAAVGKVIKDAFEAGGNLQQSFGGLDTIYGEAADAAKAFAFDAAQAGISANTYAEQAVSFGAALKQAYGGDTIQAMEAANLAIMDMADNSAKMGTDIVSIQNAYQGFAKQNYTMLDNLKLGYGGTKSEMERLLADAEKLSGVKYDISNLGDVYSAIHVVQEELGLTGVAAMEAQTTLTGSFGALKASWENTLAALTTGEGLEEALANLSASVGNFANNILSMLGSLAPQIPGFVMGLADALISNAPQLIVGGVEMIAQLVVGLVGSIPLILEQIPILFYDIVAAFADNDWGSLGIELVNGIINGIWEKASALWDTLKSLASSALQSAKAALGIGSPSKLFADSVGRWIPPGIAVGIEDNMSPLNSTMGQISSGLVADMARATAPGAIATAPRQNSEDNNNSYFAGPAPIIQISFEGSLAQLAHVLQPYIKIEENRRGPALVS